MVGMYDFCRNTNIIHEYSKSLPKYMLCRNVYVAWVTRDVAVVAIINDQMIDSCLVGLEVDQDVGEMSDGTGDVTVKEREEDED